MFGHHCGSGGAMNLLPGMPNPLEKRRDGRRHRRYLELQRRPSISGFGFGFAALRGAFWAVRLGGHS
jgi:hypothetical protein